jgi:hypothetical protein
MLYALFALLVVIDGIAWYEIYTIGGWCLVVFVIGCGLAAMAPIMWWIHRYPEVRRR